MSEDEGKEDIKDANREGFRVIGLCKPEKILQDGR